MFTTGSKLLIGSAVAAAVFAVVYGVTQGGALGTIGLISASVGLALLAAINVWVRDSNVSAMDHDAFASAAAAQTTARRSLWPLMAGIGATTVALGTVTNRATFILGVVVIVAAGVEWMIQGWSERASASRGYNEHARDVLIDPLQLPVAGAALAGVVVYAFSRIMLGLPTKTATVVAFIIGAALVVGVGSLIGTQREVRREALAGTFGISLVALIATGAYFGLTGEREIEQHHTTGDIAEENECGEEETLADAHASQTVAAKSSVAAEITFDGSQLTFDLPGYDGTSDALVVPRSTTTNVIFTNTTPEPRRLSIEMHPRLDENQVPLGPERICTGLVEHGSSQLLTLEFARPTRYVENGYWFVVPGTDATLEVVVP